MTIRAGNINGNVILRDQDIGAVGISSLNPGIISGFAVTNGATGVVNVATGRALVLATRTTITPNESFLVHVECTASENISITNGYVWLELVQSYINDGSTITDTSGIGLARINSGASLPTGVSYLPLASITAGVITDSRVTITGKAITRAGFGVGKTVIVDPATGNEVIKNSTPSSTISGTDVVMMRDTNGDEKRVAYSNMSSTIVASASGILSNYKLAGNTVSANDPMYYYNVSGAYTTLKPIGQTVSTTSIPFFASGNSEQNYTFFFQKVGTPQDITLRIETDNNGIPSGTLVNANATKTVAIANIPTNGAYMFSFPSSFTPATIGTKCYFVFSQGSNYVNASNYTNVGAETESVPNYANVSNIQSELTSSRNLYPNTNLSGNFSIPHSVTVGSNNIKINSLSWRDNIYSSNIMNVVVSITGNGLNYVYNGPLTTVSDQVILMAGLTYTITVSGTTNFNTMWTGYPTSTSNSANITLNYSSPEAWLTGVASSVCTVSTNSGMLTTYISKANATTSTKSAIYGFSQGAYATGTYPYFKKQGYITGLSGLTKGTTYYLSNTGLLSTSAGTISKVVGVAISPTTLFIDSAINNS